MPDIGDAANEFGFGHTKTRHEKGDGFKFLLTRQIVGHTVGVAEFDVTLKLARRASSLLDPKVKWMRILKHGTPRVGKIVYGFYMGREEIEATELPELLAELYKLYEHVDP